MFTGIITHFGTITTITPTTLMIKVPKGLYLKLSPGISVAVDGICLTATRLEKSDTFTINYMPETAQKTNIQYLKEGNMVNLELPVTAETLFAGHIVQGHVDGISQLENIQEEGNSKILTFSLPQLLNKYLVSKGSIAISGISLTVIEVKEDTFTVGIIPHTWEHTILHTSKIGDFVNIEVDVLAKYVEKMISQFK